jgi:hypothetical protein
MFLYIAALHGIPGIRCVILWRCCNPNSQTFSSIHAYVETIFSTFSQWYLDLGYMLDYNLHCCFFVCYGLCVHYQEPGKFASDQSGSEKGAQTPFTAKSIWHDMTGVLSG